MTRWATHVQRLACPLAAVRRESRPRNPGRQVSAWEFWRLVGMHGEFGAARQEQLCKLRLRNQATQAPRSWDRLLPPYFPAADMMRRPRPQRTTWNWLGQPPAPSPLPPGLLQAASSYPASLSEAEVGCGPVGARIEHVFSADVGPLIVFDEPDRQEVVSEEESRGAIEVELLELPPLPPGESMEAALAVVWLLSSSMMVCWWRSCTAVALGAAEKKNSTLARQ